jgi:hypothetical protein
MKRLLTWLVSSLLPCLIGGIFSFAALTLVEFILALIRVKVGLAGSWAAQTWFGPVSPQWGVAAFYFAVGCIVGCIIWFRDLPIWRAALYSAGLCYFSMGVMLTYFTFKAILVVPGFWSGFGVRLIFLVMEMVLAGIAGAVIGSLIWAVADLFRAPKHRRTALMQR